MGSMQDWETHGDDVNNGYLAAWEKAQGNTASQPAVTAPAPSAGTGIRQEAEVHGAEDMMPGGHIMQWYAAQPK